MRKTTEASRENEGLENRDKDFPPFLPIARTIRGHHGCNSVVDKVLGEERKCWQDTKREETGERERRKNEKESWALTVPKLRGIEQRAIDWMNDLIKYFPLQCILGFFSYNKET